MTEDEAFVPLTILVNTTPGPWTDETVDVWHAAFVRLAEPSTLLNVVERFVLAYTSQWRPTLGQVVEAYDDAVLWRRRRALPSGNVHCDGSGWISTGSGYRPCGRCNPAAHQAFRDQDTIDRWRDGESLATLDVGVERGKQGALRFEHGPAPACHPAHDGGITVVPAARGLVLARAAYEEECRAAGRKPSDAPFRLRAGAA